MLGKSFCVFIVLCGYVNSAIYDHIFIKHFPKDVQVKHHKFLKAKFHGIISPVKNGETRTKKISKRGIVTADSDFDIPSEIYTYENDLETGDVFEKFEGSGTDDEELEMTEDSNKPISELQKVTNISTVLTQSTAKVTKRTTDKMDISTVLTRSTTKAAKPTTEKMDIATSTITEGSGDDVSLITEEYSTNEIFTKNYITPEYDIQGKVPYICMNSTCDMNDLFIFTSEERVNIPEGINFTLTCMSNNHSHHDMLYWYKSNDSEYFLQTLGTNAQLNLNVPDTKLIHSGMYMCVKWVDKHTCCNTKSNLIIYEVPLYKYHLIIIGLVALGGVILCIFLSVRQSIVLKKYTKEFAVKHGKLKNLL